MKLGRRVMHVTDEVVNLRVVNVSILLLVALACAVLLSNIQG